MGETPDPPAEPSEEELRTMLEEREQVQAAARHRLARIGTRILAVGLAGLAIGFFSFSDNREAVASLFREPAPEPAPPPQVAKPPGAHESVEDELIRTANNVNAGPLASPDGKAISKEDIGFAMELLNFAQGPRPREETPAEKAKSH